MSINRRNFIKNLTGGILLPAYSGFDLSSLGSKNPVFWVKEIPENPYYNGYKSNLHIGLDYLLYVMADKGIKFYRSKNENQLAGPAGLIEPEDVVLIKVNAQWKYRGCTNSDLIRGLIERILEHPETFSGEIVIIENGQGRGSLKCDTQTKRNQYPDRSVHANALNKKHSYTFLVDKVFNDPRVSYYLLDPIRERFIDRQDHKTDGYRLFGDVSYPCFTSTSGNRIELKEGVWEGEKFKKNLKLINVPVLKHHDRGGSEITGALKHFYGVVSMKDGNRFRHYRRLGETCANMISNVRTPVLNIMDAIWVSHKVLQGYPDDICFQANQLMASQDPVALDYCAAKYIMYPIDNNPRHHPKFSNIDRWLTAAQNFINASGGLEDEKNGIQVGMVTKDEKQIRKIKGECNTFSVSGKVIYSDNNQYRGETSGLKGIILGGLPGNPETRSNGRYRVNIPANWKGIIVPKSDCYRFDPPSRKIKSVSSDLKKINFKAIKLCS